MLEEAELRSGGHRILIFHRYNSVVALGKSPTSSRLSYNVVGMGTSF